MSAIRHLQNGVPGLRSDPNQRVRLSPYPLPPSLGSGVSCPPRQNPALLVRASIPFDMMGLFFKSFYWRSTPFNIGVFKCVERMAHSTAESSLDLCGHVLLLKPWM